MKKELEALNGIRLANAVGKYDYDNIESYCDIIEKRLTPPTADEVCKALSDELNGNVVYVKKYNGFLLEGCIIARNDYFENGVIINHKKFALPPHLITLIGRFYEGVIE